MVDGVSTADGKLLLRRNLDFRLNFMMENLYGCRYVHEKAVYVATLFLSIFRGNVFSLFRFIDNKISMCPLS